MTNAPSVASLILCFVLAGLVAVSELISRYRDKPVSSLRAIGALAYVCVNGLSAAAAFWIMTLFNVDFGQTGSSLEPTRIMVATFGSIAFFRSSLFLVRVGDTDVGIGPSAVITTLLSAADRSVDRRRATQRSTEVVSLMGNVNFDRAHVALPTTCLYLLQNVPPAEQAGLAADVEALKSASMTDRQKSIALGLKLISFAGPAVVLAAVKALGDEITNTKPATAPTTKP